MFCWTIVESTLFSLYKFVVLYRFLKKYLNFCCIININFNIDSNLHVLLRIDVSIHVKIASKNRMCEHSGRKRLRSSAIASQIKKLHV